MTPQELINKLVNYEGPCARMCSYCPEENEVKDVKACVEELLRKKYVAEQCNDDLLKELIKIRKAYKEATGFDYRDTDGT